jgi:hypothetical protein
VQTADGLLATTGSGQVLTSSDGVTWNKIYTNTASNEALQVLALGRIRK